MTSFALRSSDNALVWVKDAPEKPAPNYEHSKSSIYKDTQWYKETGGYKDPTEWYKSALKQAIRDGIVVADEQKIKGLIIKSIVDNWGKNPIGEPSIHLNTLYHIEVEMEERGRAKDHGRLNMTSWEKRAFIVEPKEVAPDDKTGDFKPTILRQILLNVYYHQEGLYVEDAAKEIERLFAPVSKEEPKQESQSMDEAIMWEEVYFETPGSAKDFWKFFNAVTANFTITRK